MIPVMLLGWLFAVLAISVASATRSQAAGGTIRVVATAERSSAWLDVAVRLDVYTGARIGGQTPYPQPQRFLNWNFAHGWTVAPSSMITPSCPAASTWTLPVGLDVWSITVVSRRSVSIGTGRVDGAIRPPGAGSSQPRAVTSFLFPKAQAK